MSRDKNPDNYSSMFTYGNTGVYLPIVPPIMIDSAPRLVPAGHSNLATMPPMFDAIKAHELPNQNGVLDRGYPGYALLNEMNNCHKECKDCKPCLTGQSNSCKPGSECISPYICGINNEPGQCVPKRCRLGIDGQECPANSECVTNSGQQGTYGRCLHKGVAPSYAPSHMLNLPNANGPLSMPL